MRIKQLLKIIIPESIIQHKLSKSNSVLFTFDDGPHPAYTSRVLDILDDYNAKALFFIPGNRISRAPMLLNEIIDRGHGLGNHGFNHIPCNSLSYKQILHEINRTKKEIHSLTEVTTRIFRPPQGIVSLPLLFAAKSSNHRIMRWSIDSGEYSYMIDATPPELADNVLGKIHKSAIVLSHDDIDVVPKYLQIVLPKLLDEGFDLHNGLLTL